MSGDALGYTYRHSPYAGSTLLVHIALADTANDQAGNTIWFSMKRLAEKARVNQKTATIAVGRLVDDGWLTLIEERPGHPNLYQFVFRDDVPVIYEARKLKGVAVSGGMARDHTPASRGMARDHTQVWRETIPGMATDHRGYGVTPYPIAQENPRPNPRPNPTSSRDDETQQLDLVPRASFDQFWAHYPPRNGIRHAKQESLKAWESLHDNDRSHALVAVCNYATACNSGLERAANASTWLNQRRWEEWLVPAVPDRSRNSREVDIDNIVDATFDRMKQ